MDQLLSALLLARRTGLAFDLDSQPDLTPASVEDGYRLQSELTARYLAEHGGSQIGYKLGATSVATMKAMGFSEPFHGPVASIWTHQSPATLPRSDFFICAIELEVGIRLGADLTNSELDMESLRLAIAEVFPIMEIADSRYKNWKSPGAPAIVTDMGNAGALIYGAPCADWRNIDFNAIPVHLSDNGAVVAEGNGALVMEGPLGQALRFSRQRLAAGEPLRAGEIISTGTCIAPYPARAGQRLMGRIAGLGEVALNLV